MEWISFHWLLIGKSKPYSKLLMLEPSVVTPQNQYFPANSERMSVHCHESGYIGKYIHLGHRDFPRVGMLHPSALEIALMILGPRGAKSPPLGNLLGLGECIFQYIPPLGSVRTQYTSCSRECTYQILSIQGEYFPIHSPMANIRNTSSRRKH